MKVQVLQHVPFEGLGSMRPWLEARGAEIEFAHLWRGDALPAHETVDLVIAMGGPMSINDEGRYPWLAPEKAWLAEAMESRLPVLGVCLGAQLIAAVLGSPVRPQGYKEIGWFEVEGLPNPSGFAFPRRFPAFHWHGETYALPEGTVPLARSAACEQQAFQYGDRVIGLQFHLETTPQTMHGLIQRLGDELVPARWVQTARQMQAQPAASFAAIENLMGELLSWLLPD